MIDEDFLSGEQAMEKLTIRQAYDAMFYFLENYYEQTHSDDVASLLGDLSMDIWADGTPGDPAAWDDWLECVQKVLMPDTPENRQRLEQLVAHPANFLGTDVWGDDWYAQLLPDGKQLWARTDQGNIKYGGVNETPAIFRPEAGLCGPSDP